MADRYETPTDADMERHYADPTPVDLMHRCTHEGACLRGQVGQGAREGHGPLGKLDGLRRLRRVGGVGVKYVSLFSGVEAASLAWEPLGWEPVAFAEIEPFPSAVLAHRWPGVPNLGDVKKVDWRPYRGAVDLVVGGSPCQAFSVAGKREGLMDARGQLMLEYIRAVAEIEPRWFLWENVPGVLSQDRGRAFGTLLGEMADLGYSCAWRVLDAQFFGVAQRRRRVFLVGCAGGGGGAAAAVLFEPESVSGNTTSSREKRQALAANARGSSEGADGGGVTAFAQNTRDELRVQGDGTISGALAAQPGMKQQTYVAEPMVMSSGHSHAEIGMGGLVPTLTAHNQKDAPVLAINGDDVVGALCDRDFKGVGSQYVSEGKVILSWESR